MKIGVTILPEGPNLMLSGREAWALLELYRAGDKGVTTLHNPAPRWSAYILKLRQRGIDIETRHESHGGEFAGRHGRYFLRSAIAIAGSSEVRPASEAA